MKTQASIKTAVMAGAWSSIGFFSHEIGSHESTSTAINNVLSLTLLLLFFFGPVILGVIGTKNLKFGIRYSYSNESLSELPVIVIRMLVWLISVITTLAFLFMVYSYVLYR